jgi:transketolase
VDKLEAFGFQVYAIDGHDFEAIEAAMEAAKTVTGKPTAIVMKTVKGKDISFMENNAGWHGVAPNDAQFEQAMSELKAKLAELEG